MNGNELTGAIVLLLFAPVVWMVPDALLAGAPSHLFALLMAISGVVGGVVISLTELQRVAHYRATARSAEVTSRSPELL